MVEYLVGIHDFKGRSSDELDISKGDYIEVIEDDAEFGDSWYIGRNCSTNKTGLFPKVFTANAPGNEPQNNEITATMSDIDQALYDIAASAAPNPEAVHRWTPYDVRTFFISRQYSEPVADRFVQHQITGAILLELDANLLKELDIPSFGTRFEIAKEIEELRRVVGDNQRDGPRDGLRDSQTAVESLYPSGIIDALNDGASSMYPNSPDSGAHHAYATAHTTTHATAHTTATAPAHNPVHSHKQHTHTPDRASEHESIRSLASTSISGASGTDRALSGSAGSGPGALQPPQLPRKALGSPLTTPPEKAHHRRHSSVSSILSGTASTPKSPGTRLGRSDSKGWGLKSAPSQYLKPNLVKQKTSAFVEGIRDTTAEESAKTADHSGWMQKRGGMGVGSWKARFFTLHGTRLSYFTNFKDTKERGLIDITGHKALPFGADDKLVSLHATSFGAGKYGFKLLPPGPGYKKGVSFTAPRVHHFALDSEQEMHQWLQALMKATIERDDSVAAKSSCTTPVVSLPRAREIVAERLARYHEKSEYEDDSEEGDPLNLLATDSLLDPFPQ